MTAAVRFGLLAGVLAVSFQSLAVVTAQASLERLRAQGCTEVQGFLISRPIPAAGIADLLTSYRAGRQAAA